MRYGETLTLVGVGRLVAGSGAEGVAACGRCGRKAVVEALRAEGELGVGSEGGGVAACGRCWRKAVMEAVWTGGLLFII